MPICCNTVIHITKGFLEIYVADIEYHFVCFSFLLIHNQLLADVSLSHIVAQVECGYLLPIHLVCHKELLRRPSLYSSIVFYLLLSTPTSQGTFFI